MRQKFRLKQQCENALVFLVGLLCLSFASSVFSQTNSTIQLTGSETLSEGGSLGVDFRLDATFTTAITVGYTLSGDAQLGVDYRLDTSTIVIPARVDSARLELFMTTDAINEGDELIFITLTTHIGVSTGSTLTNSTLNNRLRVILRDSFETQAIQQDHGDALNATANHDVIDGLRLGTLVDTEDSGTVSLNANRDDTTAGLINIARNATIIVSSTGGGSTSNINNGRTDDGDVFITNNGGSSNLEYIHIDLGSPQSLSSVVFYGVTDNFVIMLSSSAFTLGVNEASLENNFDMADYRFTLDSVSSVEGVIRLQLPTLTNIQYLLLQRRGAGFGDLSLNEIQVYANNTTNDEDSIATLPSVFLTADSYSMTATINNPNSTSANFYGWIDFDGSGSFDADERAQSTLAAMSNGDFPLTWTVPTDITAGRSTLRLRITSDTLTTADGNASNGEIEDHALNINQEPVTATISVLTGAQEALENTAAFLISLTRSLAFPLDSTLTVFYSIDGTATAVDDYRVPPNFVTFTGLSTQATVVISVLDDMIAEGNESIRLTITTDNGASQGVDITTDVDRVDSIITLIDDDTQVNISITGDATVSENTSILTVPITIDSPLDRLLQINYSVDGSATPNVDYASLSGNLNINTGDTQAFITLNILNSALIEDNETLLFTLGGNSESANTDIMVVNAAGSEQHMLTIIDTESNVTISSLVSGVTNESEALLNYTISASEFVENTLTLTFDIEGSAIEGVDYATLPSQIIINAGQQTATLVITLIDDRLVEGDETINLTNFTRVDQGVGRFTVSSSTTDTIITDSDTVSIAIVQSKSINGSEPNSNAEFTLELTSPVERDLTVNYTVLGSAKSTMDYMALSGQQVIAMGSTSTSIVLTIIDDLIFESSETALLQLTGFVNPTNIPVSISINDDELLINDNDAATVTVVVIAPASENNVGTVTSGEFLFSRSTPNSSNTIITYAVSGSAVNNTDYGNIGTSIVIPATTTSVSLAVMPIEDTDYESTEQIIIQLITVTNVAGTVIGISSRASMELADDDISVLSLNDTNGDSISGQASSGFESNVRVFDVTNNNRLLCDEILTVDAQGRFTCIPDNPTPVNGNVINVVVTDAVDMTNVDSQTIAVDNLAPSQVVVLFANGSRVTGTTDMGVTVTITERISATDTICVTTSSTTGTFSCEFPIAQSDGTQISVFATDSAGNRTSVIDIIDARAPDTPIMFFSSASTLVGVTEEGSQVVVTRLDTNEIICNITVSVNDNNFVCPSFTTALADGLTLSLTATDNDQNTSSPTIVNVDTVEPTVIVESTEGRFIAGTASEIIDVVTVIADGESACVISDVGTSDFICELNNPVNTSQSLSLTVTDFSGNVSDSIPISFTQVPVPEIVVNGTPQGFISVSGTAVPSSQIRIIFPDASTTIAGINAGGEFVIFSPAAQPNGAVEAQVIAASGNLSPLVSVPFSETLAPTAPQVSVTTNSNGVATINGTTEPSRADDTITVSILLPDNTVNNLTADRSTGAFSLTSAEPLVSGLITIIVTDIAGNRSNTLTIEFTEQIMPVIDNFMVTQDDNGNVVITGMVEADTQITATFPNESQVITQSDSNGNFRLTSSNSQQNSGVITLGTIDSVGNVGENVIINYVESVPPILPTFETNSNELGVISFQGTAEADNTLTIILPDTTENSVVVTALGNFTFESSGNQPSGLIEVFSTDLAGNRSPVAQSNYIETVPPLAPSFSAMGSPTGLITINGSSEPGAMIIITFPDSSTSELTTSADGLFNVMSVLPQPSGIVSLQATDTNGNIGPIASTDFIETQIPATPNLQIGYIADRSFVLSGQAEALSRINIQLPNGVTRTVVTTVTGSISTAFLSSDRPLVNGDISVVSIDNAENRSNTQTIVGNFTPPTATEFLVANNRLMGITQPNIQVQLMSTEVLCTTLSDANGLFMCDSLTRPLNETDTVFTLSLTDVFFNLVQIEFMAMDQDGDGVNDAVEMEGPNQITVNGITGSDSNNDGIIDAAQNNVTTINDNPISNEASAVSISSMGSECRSFTAAESIQENQMMNTDQLLLDDEDFTYPIGLVNFTLSCEEGESISRLELYFYGFAELAKLGATIDNFVIRKFVNGEYVNLWPESDIDSITITTPTIVTNLTDVNGNPTEALRLVFELTDNGDIDNDADLLTITDPIGLAVPRQGSAIIRKKVNKNIAVVGDVLVYELIAENVSDVPLSGITLLDVMPVGFKLLEDAAIIRIGDNEPVQANLTFNGNIVVTERFNLEPGERVALSYAVAIGSGITDGVKINRASVVIGGAVISLEAQAKVRIDSDPLLQSTNIIGKVYNDKNNNQFQNKGEKGISGARIATLSGEWITTDSYGRYHYTGIEVTDLERGQNFVLKLDPTSLPDGSRIISHNPQIVRIKQGVLDKVNFAIQLPLLQNQERHTLVSPVKSEPYVQSDLSRKEPISSSDIDKDLLGKTPNKYNDGFYNVPSKKSNQVANKYLNEDLSEGFNESSSKEREITPIVESPVKEQPIRYRNLSDLILPNSKTYETVTRNYGQSFILYFKGETIVDRSGSMNKVIDVINRLQVNGKKVKLTLIGHTDEAPLKRPESIKKYGDNIGLGRYRAQVVANQLIARSNVDSSAITLESKGKKQPIASYQFIPYSISNDDNDFAWVVSLGTHNLNKAKSISTKLSRYRVKAKIDNNQYKLFTGPYSTKEKAIKGQLNLARLYESAFVDEIDVTSGNFAQYKSISDPTLSRRVEIKISYDEQVEVLDDSSQVPLESGVDKPILSGLILDNIKDNKITEIDDINLATNRANEAKENISDAFDLDRDNEIDTISGLANQFPDDIGSAEGNVTELAPTTSRRIYLTVKSDRIFDSRQGSRKLNIQGKRLIDGVAVRIVNNPKSEYIIVFDGLGGAYIEEKREFSDYLFNHKLIRSLDQTNINFERKYTPTLEDTTAKTKVFQRVPIVQIEENPIDQRSPRLQDLIDNIKNKPVEVKGSLLEASAKKAYETLVENDLNVDDSLRELPTESTDNLLTDDDKQAARDTIDYRIYNSLDNLLQDDNQEPSSSDNTTEETSQAEEVNQVPNSEFLELLGVPPNVVKDGIDDNQENVPKRRSSELDDLLN